MAEWWRSWHGGPTDPKWLVVGRRANVRPGIVSAIAWALLDHASQSEDRGKVADFDVETYSIFSGFDEAEVQAVIVAMEAKEIIVNGRLSQWERRQPKREDPTSTERGRKHRGKESPPELPLGAPVPEKAAAPEPAPREHDDGLPQDSSPTQADTDLISPQAFTLADEIAVAAGHDLEFVPPSWCGAASRVQVWLDHGWPAPIILRSAKAQMARKRDGPPSSVQYFEKGIATAIAQANAPMPTVVPFPAEVRHGKTQSALTAAADRLIAELEGGSGEVREDSSRLLSDRRRE